MKGLAELRLEVDRLGERVDYLGAALNRLRGKVTGAESHAPRDAEPNETAADTREAAEPTGRRDGWLTIAEARRNGILSR